MRMITTSTDDQMTVVSHDDFLCPMNNEDVHTVILEFGKIPVDSTVVKSLKITNGTSNEESYEVHRDPTTNPLDAVFHFNKYSWSLVPNGAECFQVRYSPPIPNERSIDYFAILNRGCTILKIVAKGTSIGPKVSMDDEISTNCLFNENEKKRVKIINESEVEAYFMFDVDVIQNPFKPYPMEGQIGARSEIYIVITFEPKYPGYHVSLLPCLVHHQAPILIRVYGYCGKQQRGRTRSSIPILIHPHLERDNFKVYMSDSDHIRNIEALDPCERDPISLSNGCIDFGRFDLNLKKSMSTTRTTSFTNHAFSDMLFQWHEDASGVFNLSPNSARVKPGETCLIEIRFDPKKENTLYERELQALAFYLEDVSSLPIFDVSMMISLRLIGHTFPADTSTWIPQYDIPPNIIMPPCLPSNPVYTTFVIRKFGHLPIMYRFIPPLETCFSVKPSQGIIRKNYQVIVVEMFPKTNNKLLYERWAMRLNGNPNYETFIDFRGFADVPCINMGNLSIEFSSTHPNCERIQPVLMLNPSRHHINYKFVDLPEEINIDVAQGKIYSNEILTHNWIFCPPTEGDYEFGILCCYSADASCHENEIMNIEMSAVGKCERGYLVAIPGELNFEKQSYDEPQNLFLELTNPGPVEIPYSLRIQHENWPYEQKDSQQQVKLQPNLGNLLPGHKETIQVTLLPRERGHHEVSIRYFIRKNFQSDCLISTNESKEICTLKYFCYMPVIKVQDLLHHRIGNNISKYVLWQLLNITKLNEMMNDLEAGESASLTMNLPHMIMHNDKSIVKLFITNPTGGIVNWSFKRMKNCSCPNISEKGKSSSYSQTNCPHTRLINITPKSGTLEVHEKSIITMELRYEMLGKYVAKWDLEMGHNRHVCLLISMTCLSGLKKTAFPLYGSVIKLKDMYIGDRDPMNQICWIYNPTKDDVSYSLNMELLKKFNEHHRLDIVDCFNPSGIVKKESFQPLILKFQPRQLGVWEVKTLLTIADETTEVTIEGECTNDPLTKITKVTTPRYDLFQIREIPVHFNSDNVNLPPLPLHSRITRIIMIHNRLEYELVAYKWKRYELPGILEIDVEPQTGRIQPEALQTFRLIITTGGKPCRINADVMCEFINQSKKRAYERSIILQKSLADRTKDYFTITESGITYPKPETILLEEPQPFYKLLSVRCYMYSPQDEELKTRPKERLKDAPPNEITIGKPLPRFSVPKHVLSLSTFILEGMISNILQSPSICERSQTTLKYSQISLNPVERERIQKRSYTTPSSRMLGKILENMIFMIVHKEFALDTIHLTQKSDARQATYPKIWQQVPGQEGRLEQSPEIQ